MHSKYGQAMMMSYQNIQIPMTYQTQKIQSLQNLRIYNTSQKAEMHYSMSMRSDKDNSQNSRKVRRVRKKSTKLNSCLGQSKQSLDVVSERKDHEEQSQMTHKSEEINLAMGSHKKPLQQEAVLQDTKPEEQQDPQKEQDQQKAVSLDDQPQKEDSNDQKDSKDQNDQKDSIEGQNDQEKQEKALSLEGQSLKDEQSEQKAVSVDGQQPQKEGSQGQDQQEKALSLEDGEQKDFSQEAQPIIDQNDQKDYKQEIQQQDQQQENDKDQSAQQLNQNEEETNSTQQPDKENSEVPEENSNPEIQPKSTPEKQEQTQETQETQEIQETKEIQETNPQTQQHPQDQAQQKQEDEEYIEQYQHQEQATQEDQAITLQDQLQIILDSQEEGRALLRKESYQEAGKKFSEAMLGVKMITQDQQDSLQSLQGNTIIHNEKPIDLLKDIVIPCHNNLALISLKLKNYQNCVKFCSKTLEIDSENTKILKRKGTALYELQEYEEAKELFRQVSKLDSKDADARHMFNKCLRRIKESNEKNKDINKQMIEQLGNDQELQEEGQLKKEFKGKERQNLKGDQESIEVEGKIKKRMRQKRLGCFGQIWMILVDFLGGMSGERRLSARDYEVMLGIDGFK